MEETRRVRFTDDYVPGPKGCPVWMVQKQWVQSSTSYVRAKTEDEALQIWAKYYEEHPNMINDPKFRDDFVGVDVYAYYHADPNYGWKE